MIHILGIYTKAWQPMVDLVQPLWREFADRHMHGLLFSEVPPMFPEHYSFTKTAVVSAAAQVTKPGDSIYVIDVDMIPTNMTYKLDETIVRATGRGAGSLAMGKDINGWNSGAYFVSCHPFNLAWLDTIVALRTVADSEQRVMWWINEPFGVGETETINSIPYHEYTAFGMELDHYSQWRPGHFVAHFPGMTMDQRLELLQRYQQHIIR